MGGGEWKVAYADFTTAMMAFFLLMWLLNAATEEQKEGIAGYFTAGSSYSTSTSSPVANNPMVQAIDALDVQEFRLSEVEQSHFAIFKELRSFLLQDAKPSSSSGLETDGTGVLMKVTSRLMFRPGTVEFSDEGKKILDEVVSIMSKYKVYLVVRGHAEPSEIIPPFKSVWELSASRANAAIRYLVAHGVPENMMRSVAYADTRPLTPSAAGALDANSRVEFSFHRPEAMSNIVGY